MNLQWRKAVRGPAGSRVNLSRSGGSVSRRVGRRLTVNSRGGGSVRLPFGLSLRFGRR